MKNKEFDITLREVQGVNGLTRNDVIDLFDMLNNEMVYPIELEAREHESVAMGFISPKAAESLDYDYEKSGLHDFIASILDDMNNEFDTCEYQFKNTKIWLSR